MFFISPNSSFRSQDISVFVLTFLVMYKNGLIRTNRLFLKSKTSQPDQQTIAMPILPNISRSKGNETMKFGQLIEYNLRNIIVEKSYTKCAAETILTPLSKISKLSISLDQQCRVLNSLFLVYANLRAIETVKSSCRPLAFT